MSDSKSSSSGIGFFGLLGIVFVVLKLCGVIDWSWWWVTSPFWGGFVLIAVVTFVCGLAFGLYTVVNKSIKQSKGSK